MIHWSVTAFLLQPLLEAVIDEIWKFAFALGKTKLVKGEVDAQTLGDRFGLTGVSNASRTISEEVHSKPVFLDPWV